MNDTILESIKNSNYFGLIIYDNHGKIIEANGRIADLLGYSVENLNGKNMIDFIPNAVEDTKYIFYNNLLEKDFLMEDVNYTFESRKGSLILLSVSTYVISFNGNDAGMAIMIDKTSDATFEKLYSSISQINNLIIRVSDEESLIEGICDILVGTIGYEAVLAGYIDDSKLLKPKYAKAKSAEHEEFIKTLKVGVDLNTPYGKGSVARAFNTKRISIVSDVLNDANMSEWREYYKRFNINSVCSIPILKDEQVIYIFLILDSTRNAFSENKIGEILELADLFIGEMLDILHKAIENNEISYADLYDENYIAIPDTDPEKYKTVFTDFIKKNIQEIEDKYLKMNYNFRYFALMDRNGYAPSHNSIYDQPLTGNYEYDMEWNRSMRIFDDPISTADAKNTDKFIIQTYTKDTGESVSDIAVPIFISKKHWGCIRIGASEEHLELLEEIQKNISFALEKIESQRNLLILQEKLKIAAFYDALTGLPNRRALIDELDKAIHRASRQKWILAVAMMDLDGFKPVNDTYGHEAGDTVLQVIGERFKNSLRKTDFVSRIGGDEFVIILEDCKNIENIIPILNKIEKNVKIPIAVAPNKTIIVGLSMGLHFCNIESDMSADAILRYADNALYKSKEHKADRKNYWTITNECK